MYQNVYEFVIIINLRFWLLYYCFYYNYCLQNLSEQLFFLIIPYFLGAIRYISIGYVTTKG